MSEFWRQQRAAMDTRRREHLSDQLEIRLLDGNLEEWKAIGGGEVSVSFEATETGSGAYQCDLPTDHPVAQPLIELDEDDALIVVAQTASYRWCGFDAGQARGLMLENGAEFVRHQAVELTQLLDDLVLLRNPRRPIDNQPEKAEPRQGRAVSLAKEILAEAVNRQWPTRPVRVVPAIGEDTSEPITIVPDTQSALQALTDALAPTGCQLRVWVWFEGDPVPLGLEDLSSTTILIDVVDLAAFAGWSGDLTDGLTQYKRVLSGGGFYPAPVWAAIDASENQPDDRVVWHTDLDGVESLSFLTCPARGARVMWSGLRQGWLREVIGQDASEAAAAGVIHHAAELADTISSHISNNTFVTDVDLSDSTGSGTWAWAQVQSNMETFRRRNLSIDLSKGFNANNFAAGVNNVNAPETSQAAAPTVWSEVTDEARYDKLKEVWRGSQAVAQGTHAEDMITVLYNRRGHRYLRVAVTNGSPWLFGVDFGLGSVQGYYLPLAGRVWVDRVTRARFSRQAGTTARWQLTVGDGGFADPPVVRTIRALRRTAAAFAQYARDTSAAATSGGA